MGNKTLALVLAAGEGKSVKHLLGEDEPTKAMIKIGEKRLIDLVLDSLEGLDVEKAVLSYPADSYGTLDERVKQRNVKVLKQKLWHMGLPYATELPVILLIQYHLSKDKNYLQSFDSVTTLPCDIVLKDVDLKDLLRFHYNNIDGARDRQVTMVSKKGLGSGRAELFKMHGRRIIGRIPYKGQRVKSYEILTQAGIYIFSRELLRTPFFALPTLNSIKLLAYQTHGDWIDYGNPYELQKFRHKAF